MSRSFKMWRSTIEPRWFKFDPSFNKVQDIIKVNSRILSIRLQLSAPIRLMAIKCTNCVPGPLSSVIHLIDHTRNRSLSSSHVKLSLPRTPLVIQVKILTPHTNSFSFPSLLSLLPQRSQRQTAENCGLTCTSECKIQAWVYVLAYMHCFTQTRVHAEL